ncbi:MAG: hypothetical protein WCQ11_07760 [Actinomycetes bacterium]
MTIGPKQIMSIYRIIDPINRIIDLKELKSQSVACSWLRQVQIERKDSFLELQTKVGRKWVALDPPA